MVIDLYIETTTASAPYVPAATNELKNGAAGTPTFGQINLQGPFVDQDADSRQDADSLREVELTFTFKRRDTGAEVQIPWMQFTLFDFDHNMNDGDRGQEVNPTPAPAPPHPLRIAPTDPRSRGAWPESQCATASGFEDYAVSSGEGVISSGGGAPVTTRVDMQSLNFQGGINTGARTCTQAASPHAATPARRLCAADATPLRTAQGNGARWTGAPEATTRPTR